MAQIKAMKVEDVGIITKEEFITHAQMKVKSAFDNYQTLYKFNTRLYESKMSFCADKIFDIIFLFTNPGVCVLQLLVNNLKYHRTP